MTADEREVIEAAGQYRVAVIANDAHPTQASAARRENAECHHPRLGPSGPPPLPPGQEWAAARRRRDALTALANVTAPRTLP